MILGRSSIYFRIIAVESERSLLSFALRFECKMFFTKKKKKLWTLKMQGGLHRRTGKKMGLRSRPGTVLACGLVGLEISLAGPMQFGSLKALITKLYGPPYCFECTCLIINLIYLVQPNVIAGISHQKKNTCLGGNFIFYHIFLISSLLTCLFSAQGLCKTWVFLYKSNSRYSWFGIVSWVSNFLLDRSISVIYTTYFSNWKRDEQNFMTPFALKV